MKTHFLKQFLLRTKEFHPIPPYHILGFDMFMISLRKIIDHSPWNTSLQASRKFMTYFAIRSQKSSASSTIRSPQKASTITKTPLESHQHTFGQLSANSSVRSSIRPISSKPTHTHGGELAISSFYTRSAVKGCREYYLQQTARI